MAFVEIFNTLLNKMPVPNTIIKDSEDERYACFDINQVVPLKTLINSKFPTITHLHVDKLESENGAVFNIMFFDETGEHVSGCELSKDQVFWDDDE